MSLSERQVSTDVSALPAELLQTCNQKGYTAMMEKVAELIKSLTQAFFSDLATTNVHPC